MNWYSTIVKNISSANWYKAIYWNLMDGYLNKIVDTIQDNLHESAQTISWFSPICIPINWKIPFNTKENIKIIKNVV